MRKSFRLALLVCAGFAGLALAGPALAKYDPSLTIEQSSYKLGAAATADVFIASSDDADATAQMKIFSPAGYSANLTQAPGTKIGVVVAVVKAKALGGALLPLAGDVLVANPASPAIASASLACTHVPATSHTTIWVLNTSLQGQTVAIPVFVDKTGPFVIQTVCLPSPDIPEASGGAKFGAQLVLADFSIKGVFTNASTKGGYEWSGIYTPYTAGTGAPNPAGTVEWRTYVGLPSSLTLKKAKAKRGFKLTGQLKIAGLNPKGVRLGVYAGKKAKPAPTATSSGTGKRIARSGRLPKTGKYSVARPNVKFATFFQTRFENYGTSCDQPSPSGLPVPCSGEDIAAVTSSQIKVLKPKKKKRR
jgi:hypothetical protein